MTNNFFEVNNSNVIEKPNAKEILLYSIFPLYAVVNMQNALDLGTTYAQHQQCKMHILYL